MIALLYMMLAATAVTLAGLPALVLCLMFETCAERARARRASAASHGVESPSPSSGSPDRLAA